MARIKHETVSGFQGATGLGTTSVAAGPVVADHGRATTIAKAKLVSLSDRSERVGSIQAHQHPGGGGLPIMGSLTVSHIATADHHALPVRHIIQSPHLLALHNSLEVAGGLQPSHPSLQDVMRAGMGDRMV